MGTEYENVALLAVLSPNWGKRSLRSVATGRRMKCYGCSSWLRALQGVILAMRSDYATGVQRQSALAVQEADGSAFLGMRAPCRYYALERSHLGGDAQSRHRPAQGSQNAGSGAVMRYEMEDGAGDRPTSLETTTPTTRRSR